MRNLEYYDLDIVRLVPNCKIKSSNNSQSQKIMIRYEMINKSINTLRKIGHFT